MQVCRYADMYVWVRIAIYSYRHQHGAHTLEPHSKIKYKIIAIHGYLHWRRLSPEILRAFAGKVWECHKAVGAS